MVPSGVAAFALAAFAVVVVPGPSVVFAVSRAISLGQRVALLTVAGNATGLFVQVLLLAVGLGLAIASGAVQGPREATP